MTAQDEAKKQKELAEARRLEALQNAQRVRDLAVVLQAPEVERLITGPDGYLGGLEAGYLEDLADEKKVPVNDLVRMAVALTRWRDMRALRADLRAKRDAPAVSLALQKTGGGE